MNAKKDFKRIPKHIGVIPDGNRRWAVQNHLEKQDGYQHGVNPGYRLYELLLEYGVKEATFYGFTKDNTTRPAKQTSAFVQSCVDAVNLLSDRDANLLVIGKKTAVFPKELEKFANQRVYYGNGDINVNFLINYDWEWDIGHLQQSGGGGKRVNANIMSSDISRIDLIIRWGGRRRLSGFLPVQSVYSDFYVVDEYWPDFKEEHFINALQWYQDCDVTLGG